MANKHIEKRRAEEKKKKRQQLTIMIGLAVILLGLLSYNSFFAPMKVLTSEISVQEANDLRENGAFILDVREQYEWDEKHIPGATLIPLGELASRVDELPDNQEIVVVCRSGNRSQTGRDILIEAGFDSVTSMAGGINQWISSGFEAVFGP